MSVRKLKIDYVETNVNLANTCFLSFFFEIKNNDLSLDFAEIALSPNTKKSKNNTNKIGHELVENNDLSLEFAEIALLTNDKESKKNTNKIGHELVKNDDLSLELSQIFLSSNNKKNKTNTKCHALAKGVDLSFEFAKIAIDYEVNSKKTNRKLEELLSSNKELTNNLKFFFQKSSRACKAAPIKKKTKKTSNYTPLWTESASKRPSLS